MFRFLSPYFTPRFPRGRRRNPPYARWKEDRWEFGATRLQLVTLSVALISDYPSY